MSNSSSKGFVKTLAFLGGLATIPFLTTQLSRYMLRSIMTEPYLANLAELFSATKRTGVQNIIETNLRSERASILKRPLGSPRHFTDFSGLMFTSAHLETIALPQDSSVKIDITIGPKAKKPLLVSTPLLVSAMAYQKGVTAQFKYALAQGSSKAGSLTNTGEGPFLPKERALADRLIIQYPRTPHSRSIEILQQADALEIQIGQGASAGSSQSTFWRRITTDLPQFKTTKDLPKIVKFLKEVGGGVPVGTKFSFTHNLEAEIDLCLEAGVDYLALEGFNAGTIESPPILEDDFGLPTIIGLSRAVAHLKKRKMEKQVSLLVSGGFITPGQCLKALALGADGIYLGTAALFATSHTQTLKAIPWEPPTQLAAQGGTLSHKFDWQLGARHLSNFLQASAEELKEGIRTMGKADLALVGPDDLIAIDETTSRITGIPLAYSK